MTTPHDALVAGRELISDPDRWTQRTLARDKKGEVVPQPWDVKATCFCSIGAIHKVLGPAELELKFELREYLNQAAGTSQYGIAMFNDSHTHAEVLAVWDKAIELARSDERYI